MFINLLWNSFQVNKNIICYPETWGSDLYKGDIVLKGVIQVSIYSYKILEEYILEILTITIRANNYPFLMQSHKYKIYKVLKLEEKNNIDTMCCCRKYISIIIQISQPERSPHLGWIIIQCGVLLIIRINIQDHINIVSSFRKYLQP